MSERERRQVPRYIAEFRGQVAQPPGAPAQNITVVNISVSGCSLEGAGDLKAGQHCELSFEREGHHFNAEATVTWKSTNGEAGLKFLYVSPADQELLKKICATLHLQPLIHRGEE